MINIILIIIISICLVFEYKKTLLLIACLYPILNMFGGLGPISLTMAIGMVAFVVAVVLHRRDLKRCPIIYISFPFIMICIISNFINEHHTPSMMGFISSNILLPLVLWGFIKTKDDVKLFLKVFTIYFLIISIYGYYEAITNSNPFATWACDENNELLGGYYGRYSDEIRYGLKRIQSLMLWRDACGAISALFWGLLYYIRIYKREYIDTYWMSIATTALILMLPVTVLLTGTRACIATLAVCILGTFRKINIYYTLIIFIACFIAFFYADSYLSSISQSYSETDNVGGSSLTMRQVQLSAVLLTLRQSPFFGNGFGSWLDYSIWGDEIEGAESLWFQLLLKVGVLGTLSFVILLALLIWRIIKSRTPYAIFIILAYIVGKTLSSLSGVDLSLLIIILSLMIRTSNNKDEKSIYNVIRRKISCIHMRTNI